jgi:uncharacterized protein YkwD
MCEPFQVRSPYDGRLKWRCVRCGKDYETEAEAELSTCRAVSPTDQTSVTPEPPKFEAPMGNIPESPVPTGGSTGPREEIDEVRMRIAELRKEYAEVLKKFPKSKDVEIIRNSLELLEARLLELGRGAISSEVNTPQTRPSETSEPTSNTGSTPERPVPPRTPPSIPPISSRRCGYCGRSETRERRMTNCWFCGLTFCPRHIRRELHHCSGVKEPKRTPEPVEQEPIPVGLPKRRRSRVSLPNFKHIRIKHSYAFLLMWAVVFLTGLLVVPGSNLIELLVEAFANALLLFIVIYGVLGIFKPGVGRKAFGVLLILLLVGFFYQTPSALSTGSVKSIFVSEDSLLSSLESLNANRNTVNPSTGTSTSMPTSSTTGPQEVSSVSTTSSTSVTLTSASALSDPSFYSGKATIWYPPDNPTLATYALGLINQDRKANGLSPVSLSEVPSGQQHADSMVYYGYFSHWDPQGYKPYMRYSLLGGTGAVAENIGQTNCTDSSADSTLLTVQPCDLTTIENGIAASEWGMMNNDLQCCNNGHRDNILDPQHNRVSIGIAYDTTSSTIYFVEDFEDYYLGLSGPVAGSGNSVTIQGSLSKSLGVTQLVVYYDPTPTAMTVSELDSTFAYGPGSFVGGVFPPCSNSCEYYPGAVSVYASKWQVTSSGIAIEFSLADFKNADGAGVYTIYLQTGDNTGTAFITYSIFIQS